jgi:hypothetical protein
MQTRIERANMPPTALKRRRMNMTIKYQIHGYDKYWQYRPSMMSEDYIEPALYDTYAEAHAKAHSNHEWVVKVEVETA